jgi:hypothetical protein
MPVFREDHTKALQRIVFQRLSNEEGSGACAPFIRLALLACDCGGVSGAEGAGLLALAVLSPG